MVLCRLRPYPFCHTKCPSDVFGEWVGKNIFITTLCVTKQFQMKSYFKGKNINKSKKYKVFTSVFHFIMVLWSKVFQILPSWSVHWKRLLLHTSDVTTEEKRKNYDIYVYNQFQNKSHRNWWSSVCVILFLTISKSRNGESGNGMRRLIGTRGIRVRTREIKVGMWGMAMRMLGMRGILGIRVILCENLRVYCFG